MKLSHKLQTLTGYFPYLPSSFPPPHFLPIGQLPSAEQAQVCVLFTLKEFSVHEVDGHQTNDHTVLRATNSATRTVWSHLVARVFSCRNLSATQHCTWTGYLPPTSRDTALSFSPSTRKTKTNQQGHTSAVVRWRWHADNPRSPFCSSALPPGPRTVPGRDLTVRVSAVSGSFLLPHVQPSSPPYSELLHS